MDKPQAVLFFDLDGTLVFTLPSLVKAGNAMLEHFSLPACSPQQYRRFLGDGSRKLVARLLESRGAGVSVDQALPVYLAYYREYCLYAATPYPDLPDLLLRAKAGGYRLAVLTNKPHPMAVAVVEHAYGPSLFDCIQGQLPGRPVKPDPSLLAALRDQLPTDPKQSYFIGDSAVDIKTGQAGAIPTIGVLWGYRERPELEAAGADYIVEDVAGLENILLNREGGANGPDEH